jgi:UrcA family protein
MNKPRFTSINSILAVGFLALAGAAMSGRVQGAETPQFNRSIVTFGDLNLDSEQGTRALYARLRNGAEDVCSSFQGRDLFFKRVWQSCFNQALTAAVEHVNSPSLTTLHNQVVNRPKIYR